MALCICRWRHEDVPEKRFYVSYMTWDTFMEAVMAFRHNCKVIERLAKADLVIGGIDMSVSYL